MSAYAELSAALRGPMREWWRGTGAWLLLAMAVCWSVGTVINVSGLYDPREAPHLSPPVAVLFALAGSAAGIGAPLIWLLAAQAATRIQGGPQSNAAAAQRFSRRLVFLYCLQQGLWPLLLVAVLRLIQRLAVDLAYGAEGTLLSSTQGSAEGTLFYLQDFLPVILLAMGLLVATRRIALPMTLALSQLISNVVWGAARFDEGSPPPWEPEHWWLWELQMLSSAALIAGLFYGLLAGRRRLWLAIYSLLVGVLVLPPLLDALYSRVQSELLLYAVEASYWADFLFWSNSYIGDWLQAEFSRALTVEETVLGYLAPAFPALWAAFMLGSLFALLYWLLGEPWRGWKGRGVAPEAGLEARSAR